MMKASWLAVASIGLLFLTSSSCSKYCSKQHTTSCQEGATYWQDSCGKLGELVEQCECGCDSEQIACEPDCGCQSDADCVELAYPFCDQETGICLCIPSCQGRVCGDDGCGGSCEPGCFGNEACNFENGQCYCYPNCYQRSCGSDGCGCG